MRVEKLIQLKPEEEVLSVVHEAVVPHLPKFVAAFLLVVAPFFFMFFLFQFGLIGVAVFFILEAFALVFGSQTFIGWSNTVLVVTDRRVIDVEQRGLFERVVSETPYERIDDASYRIKGLLPMVFRYGTVRLALSGAAPDISFRRVRHPARVHNLINDLRGTVKDEAHDRREEKIREMAKSLSVEEIAEVAGEVRKKEQKEALETLYDDDHAS